MGAEGRPPARGFFGHSNGPYQFFCLGLVVPPWILVIFLASLAKKSSILLGENQAHLFLFSLFKVNFDRKLRIIIYLSILK